jgi:hypothetical protein
VLRIDKLAQKDGMVDARATSMLISKGDEQVDQKQPGDRLDSPSKAVTSSGLPILLNITPFMLRYFTGYFSHDLAS